MLVQFALANHQSEIAACLHLQPGAISDLQKLRSLIHMGEDDPLVLEERLATAIYDLSFTNSWGSLPLEVSIMSRSPIFTGAKGPYAAHMAIACALAQEIAHGGSTPGPGLLALAKRTGMNLPEEQLDLLVKAKFAHEALGLPLIHPLNLFFEGGGHLNSPHKSRFSAGVLNALDDINPWRDPTPKMLRGLPANHPLTQITEIGLPALLFHLYHQQRNRQEGMGRVANRLSELWSREAPTSPILSNTGMAYALLRGVYTRRMASHKDYLGPWSSTMDHIAAVTGGGQALAEAERHLGLSSI